MVVLSEQAPVQDSSSELSSGRMWLIASLALTIKAVLLFVLLPYLLAISPQDYAAERFPDNYDFIAWNLVQGNGYRMYPDTTA